MVKVDQNVIVPEKRDLKEANFVSVHLKTHAIIFNETDVSFKVHLTIPLDWNQLYMLTV